MHLDSRGLAVRRFFTGLTEYAFIAQARRPILRWSITSPSCSFDSCDQTTSTRCDPSEGSD